MSNKNILAIDARIRQRFREEYDQLSLYKKKLTDLEKSLKSKTLSGRLYQIVHDEYQRLTEYIKNIEKKSELNFYIAESVNLIEEYKIMLQIPIKMNFMGKPIKENKLKKKLIKKYLDVASKYIDIDKSKESTKPNIVCHNCRNKKDFDIMDGNTYICMKCFAQQTVMKHNSSYNDIDRVNISTKYMYDRKVHFRDCVKQYQGKQNCTIPVAVYNDLEEQFKLHHLLIETNNDNQSRFKNVTKNHILMFLKELGYSNHYENVHLIHSTLTGIKPDDISHLEDQLLDDFDALTELYDRKFKHLTRKNFINTQYVLYQLLLRHKHPCKKEEFIILKTIDRKLFHDEVCQELFTHLGWNSTPFY